MQSSVNIFQNTQTLLDDITANIYNKRILDFQQPQNDLLDVLRTKSETVQCNTEGKYVTTIKDSWGSSVIPGGVNATLPDGDYSLDVSKISLGILQYYANAELTAHDMEFLGGGATLHNINVVSDSLDKMLQDIKWAQSCWAFGNGTGQLCTAYVASTATGDRLQLNQTVNFDLSNTYLDLGIDGAKWLLTGKLLDVYDPTGTTKKATVLVKHITRQRIRRTVNPVKDSFRAYVVWTTDTSGSTVRITDGDRIYGRGWHDSGRDNVMQGIRQIVNPVIALDASAPTVGLWNIDPTSPFQNHHRGSELQNIRTINRNTDDAEIFRSQLWRSNSDGTSFGRVTNTTELTSTYPGTGLCDWDLGTIRQVLDSVDFDNKNSAKVDTLFMNSAMANMFWKISKDKITITETSAQAEISSQRGFDITRAKQFIREDGTPVTIHVTPWINNNEILGMSSNDMFILEGPAAHFLSRNGGGVWEPTYMNNKDNWQAPYKGFINMGAYRCDKCFWIQGLKDINN